MPKIKIMTDSASDISYENENKYDIQIVPFKVAMGNKSYISRNDFDNAQFYGLMEEYDGIPVTSQVTPYEFVEIFRQQYESGYTDVINVIINSEGSATYNNAVIAREDFFAEHPKAKGNFAIYNIDSRSYSGGYGFAVIEAAKMAERGMPADEIVGRLNDWCENSVVIFAPYTLKYAAKSGRIPSAAAFVGEALGLRPIMRIHDHVIQTEEKVRGEKNIIPAVEKLTAAEIEPGSPYCIIYGDDEKVRDSMAEAMTASMGYPPADFYQIGAAVAVNAGPRVVGTIFKGKK
ncbi:MAG: DegV family protein [Oscillospiraceae bacterium]